MKKLILSIFIIGSIFLFTGCNKVNNQKSDDPKTIVDILTSSFEDKIKDEKDLNKLAEYLSKNDLIKTKMMIEENPEYLPGFTTTIEGYDKVVKVSPSISTIPFVLYIFESKDPKKLAETLEESADLRWNICTEADDKNIVIKDNYVFFIMAPTSFDE